MRLWCRCFTSGFLPCDSRGCMGFIFTLFCTFASSGCGSTDNMITRLFRRLIWSVVTLLGTAFFTFFLLNAVPGDVARVIAGSKASPDVIKEIHAKYHLDDPLW